MGYFIIENDIVSNNFMETIWSMIDLYSWFLKNSFSVGVVYIYIYVCVCVCVCLCVLFVCVV